MTLTFSSKKEIAKQHNYKHLAKGKELQRHTTSNHPLKAITVTVAETRSKSQKAPISNPLASNDQLDGTDPLMDGADPLSMMAAQLDDPLSKLANSSMTNKPSTNGVVSKDFVDFDSWSNKRNHILSKYTTSQKLSISVLTASAKATPKAAAGTVTDKVKNRLEQLDDFEEGSVQEMLDLSQQDYMHRIDDLNTALIIAWNQDQRVKALKIAIQCAKLLADVSVIQFYPSKFVLITDILDTFGKLVYDRIKSKAQYNPKGGSPIQLPDNFSPDMVCDSAKETCRNWFYKIASIRELVPRFYVEVAILKSYNFLTSGEYSEALSRLSNMTRGIGDPLVAIYARCYLCRVGIDVAPSIRTHLMKCFEDFITTYSQIQSPTVQKLIFNQKIDQATYLTLYCPALDWMMQCLASGAKPQTLLTVIEKCRKHCNSALLLNSVLSAFKPAYISNRAEQFIEMIKECEENGLPKYLLYRSLGTCLVVAPPPEEDRLACLNNVWRVVMKLKCPKEYIACAEVWVEYVVLNFAKREVNTVLGDVLKHMTPDRAFEDFYPQLQNILSKVVTHMQDFSVVFSMSKFLPFLDMFQKDSVKVEVCKDIVKSYISQQIEPTCDPVITGALMSICKMMHDSVNALTLEDDVRLISELINSFIRTISYGKDFEQQLSFYVDCRAAFSNTDAVLTYLVQSVNRLIIDTQRIVKGHHSKKTASFVRACVAYVFITIPSLSNIFMRLKLYLICGHVAIINNCLSQGDAFFKTIVSIINEVPKSMEIDGKMRSSDPQLMEFILNFTSALLVIPDSPDHGVLYFVRGLLNVITQRQWDSNHGDTKVIIYMNMLAMLSAMSQQQYLYHAQNVESNDKLYGGDDKFINEVQTVCVTLVNQILTHLNTLNATEHSRRQAQLALDLFNRFVAHGDLNNENMFEMAVNLWNLAQKNGQLDTKHMVRGYSYVGLKAHKPDGEMFAALHNRMSLQSKT